jgi:hypothetical protein
VIGRHLNDARLDVSALDTALNFKNEEIGELVRRTRVHGQRRIKPMTSAGNDLHAGLPRRFLDETNVAADIGRGDVDDGVHAALAAHRLEFVDHHADEIRPTPEELRPGLHETRRTRANMFVRQSEAELGGIHRLLHRLNDTTTSLSGLILTGAAAFKA